MTCTGPLVLSNLSYFQAQGSALSATVARAAPTRTAGFRAGHFSISPSIYPSIHQSIHPSIHLSIPSLNSLEDRNPSAIYWKSKDTLKKKHFFRSLHKVWMQQSKFLEEKIARHREEILLKVSFKTRILPLPPSPPSLQSTMFWVVHVNKHSSTL